jgi:Ca2+-binding RTX toxin-like protein
VQYIAPAGGTAMIDFTVGNMLGESAIGTIDVTIDPGPSITLSSGPLDVTPGGTLVIGTVTAGLAGDVLSLGSIVAAGSLSLQLVGGNEELVYVAPAYPVGNSDAISFSVSDPLHDTVSAGATITVDAPPTISGVTAMAGILDSGTIDPFAHVTIAATTTSEIVTARITLSSGGTGTLSNSGTFTGTAAAVSAAIDALVFTPTAHQVAPGGTITTGFTLSVTDSILPTTTQATTLLTVTAANNAPVISGAVAGQSATVNSTIMPFASVVVSDVDFGVTDSLTITVTGGGTLSGSGLIKTGTGVYSLAAATPATLTSDLQALSFTTSTTPGTTNFQLAATQIAGGSTLATTNSTTSVVVAGPNYIYGPPYGNAVIEGTPGADDIIAYQWYNTIYSNGGNDIINAGQGNGTVYAAGGNDLITLGGYNGIVSGGNGSDTIGGSQGNSTITLGNGNDSLSLGGYYNLVTLGNGNDTITGPQGNTTVTLGNGSDIVTLAGYNNVVHVGTTTGTDYLDVGAGNETITGGGGTLVVLAGGYGDVVTLGNGTDYVFTAPAGPNPSVPAGVSAPVEQGSATVTTGSGNDTIQLAGYGNVVNAGGGMNFIHGGSGNDQFFLPTAGSGSDSITGFSETNGDILNLVAALAATGWNHASNTLGNYLQVTASGGNTTLSIVPTGTGAATPIAILMASGNLGLSDLLSHNSLKTS